MIATSVIPQVLRDRERECLWLLSETILMVKDLVLGLGSENDAVMNILYST